MIWRIYLQKSRNANAAGDVDGAVENLEKMMKWHPNLKARVLYGYYLLKQGRTEDAERVFERYIMPLRSVRRKEKVKKKGKYQKQTYIKRNKKELLAKTNYALLLWKRGRIDEAVDMLEYVFRRMRTTVIYGNLGYLYIVQGNLEKALKFNEKAYEFAPQNNVILDNLGCTLLALGKLQEAKDVYEEMFQNEKPPKFPEAFYDYGQVKEQLGDLKGAKELYQKALTYPFSGLSNVTKEEVEQALQRLEKAGD